MTTPRAWSFLVVEGTRQYGGNDGYNDSPSETYHYDTDVANHLQVAEGDVAIIRTRDHVKGVAVIEQIVTGEGRKERRECQEFRVRACIMGTKEITHGTTERACYFG
ncbi:hypothetical protein C8J32_11150 [Rhizobium sp. PP-CC-3A-592]|nr:hypothetical protein C8J32_11150 [Rhizobium sp. PP-CC-3A-592]